MVTAVVGGALALLGVLVGGWTSARFQRSQWLRDAQLHACERLLNEFAELYDALALSRRGAAQDLSWSAWNQALTSISITCDASVVELAYLIDRAFWHADWEIRGGKVGQENWLELRPSLERARADFLLAARKQTDPKSKMPDLVSGRPADTDAMWQANRVEPGTHAPDAALHETEDKLGP